MNPEARTMLPGIAFAGFQSRFREPQMEEGFADITTVDFEVCSSLVSLMRAWRLVWFARGRDRKLIAICDMEQFTGTAEQRQVWAQYWT